MQLTLRMSLPAHDYLCSLSTQWPCVDPLTFALLTVDVTQAGEGQLEIMVNRGQVPNSVKMLRKGIFLVSFVPRDARPHTVDIKFNGELIPREYLNSYISSIWVGKL